MKPATAGLAPAAWQRWEARVERWAPYALLAISTVLTVADPASAGSRSTIVLVAALAAAWVAGAFTLPPPAWRARVGPLLVYFAGLLAISSVLMALHPLFFLFAITGFFHAVLLRPWPVVVLGIGLTSFAIHALTWGGVPTDDFGMAVMFVTIIVIQTAAISGGYFGSAKLTELSEQRRQMVDRLQATLAENAGLHAQLVSQAREAAVRDERQRMAHELHDTLAQGLVGVITQLEAASQSRDDDAELDRHLDKALALARESLRSARRSVLALQPDELEAAGLPEALSALAEDWSNLHGVPVQTHLHGPISDLHPEVEMTLLRVAQESLANVAKHARATRVGLTLSFTGDEVALDVRDDGIGFEVPNYAPRVLAGAGAPGSTSGSAGTAADGGFGLSTMRARVERLSGSLVIESSAGDGTAVSARVPAIPPVDV